MRKELFMVSAMALASTSYAQTLPSKQENAQHNIAVRRLLLDVDKFIGNAPSGRFANCSDVTRTLAAEIDKQEEFTADIFSALEKRQDSYLYVHLVSANTNLYTALTTAYKAVSMSCGSSNQRDMANLLMMTANLYAEISRIHVDFDE